MSPLFVLYIFYPLLRLGLWLLVCKLWLLRATDHSASFTLGSRLVYYIAAARSLEAVRPRLRCAQWVLRNP